MRSQKRRILITGALPYANGSLHIGHLVGYFQADMWKRFQKMLGHECYYICGDDTHGTPVMVSAQKQAISPEVLIDRMWKEHFQDFADFQVEFDHYTTTNSKTNQQLCEFFFNEMKKRDAMEPDADKRLYIRSIDQLYCEHDKMFLPDRFVKGDCPNCASAEQYGDNCEVCGAVYSPNDLKKPHCSICGTTPILKSSDHFFFNLNKFKLMLQSWVPEATSAEAWSKLREWFDGDLKPWDISRDAPYFGFEIPGYKNKFFYVWVDAPMGYISGFKEFCSKNPNLKFDDFWKKGQENETEVYHLIGKDILYFHSLFWPAFLECADFRKPTKVWAHGRLTINGEKMSKSRGNGITARNYLKHLDPTFLRYYFASKMNSSMNDFDWAETDFIQKVNAELIGKITNLASRSAQIINKSFDSKLSSCDADGLKVVENIFEPQRIRTLENHYHARDFSQVLTLIRDMTEEANKYFDEKSPWKMEKVESQKVLTSTLNIFKNLLILIKPIIPEYAKKAEVFLNLGELQWSHLSQMIPDGHQIKSYVHLVQRIDPLKVKALIEETKMSADTKPLPDQQKNSNFPPDHRAAATTSGDALNTSSGLPRSIEMEDFDRVDLRVALILEAESVPTADKLLKLKVDLGPLGQKTIFSGIKLAYDPVKLKGRKTIIVNNLKPRKMKFGISEGMILAAGAGGASLFIFSPDEGALPGDRVK